MNCGNYGYYPANMMRNSGAQQPMAGFQPPGGFQPTTDILSMMHSGPAFAVPTVPLGGVREESFIENILRFNQGKIGTFYFTYQGNSKWNAMVYHGRVETAGRDHIIISDPSSGKRYLLLMANLDWVEFNERINYPLQEVSPDVQATMTTSE